MGHQSRSPVLCFNTGSCYNNRGSTTATSVQEPGMAYIKGQTSQGTIFKIGNVYYANYRRNGRQIKKSLGTKDRSIALYKLQQLIADPVEGNIQFARVVAQALDTMKIKGHKSYEKTCSHANPVTKALGHMSVKD